MVNKKKMVNPQWSMVNKKKMVNPQWSMVNKNNGQSSMFNGQ